MFLKKFKMFIAITMVIMLLSSITAFATVKQGIMYTALGDSIAYGTGATDRFGYTDMFNAHLEEKFGEGMYINLSQDGVTSEDLLAALKAPGDPLFLQSAVTTADVITISIGGNDLLRPFLLEILGVIQLHYVIPGSEGAFDIEEFMLDFAEWEIDSSSQPQFSVMLENLSVSLTGLVGEFAVNWGQIIQEIRSLNLQADIYVNTVYNPLKFSPALYQFADLTIQGLNAPIIGFASTYDYKVVDVNSKFASYNNPKKLAVGDLSTLAMFLLPDYGGSVPLHPTDMGYKFIFNMHKDLMD